MRNVSYTPPSPFHFLTAFTCSTCSGGAICLLKRIRALIIVLCSAICGLTELSHGNTTSDLRSQSQTLLRQILMHCGLSAATCNRQLCSNVSRAYHTHPRQAAPMAAAAAATTQQQPVLLLDVMDTLVTDPFFEHMPPFFDMTFKELLAAKHPTGR